MVIIVILKTTLFYDYVNKYLLVINEEGGTLRDCIADGRYYICDLVYVIRISLKSSIGASLDHGVNITVLSHIRVHVPRGQ